MKEFGGDYSVKRLLYDAIKFRGLIVYGYHGGTHRVTGDEILCVANVGELGRTEIVEVREEKIQVCLGLKNRFHIFLHNKWS